MISRWQLIFSLTRHVRILQRVEERMVTPPLIDAQWRRPSTVSEGKHKLFISIRLQARFTHLLEIATTHWPNWVDTKRIASTWYFPCSIRLDRSRVNKIFCILFALPTTESMVILHVYETNLWNVSISSGYRGVNYNTTNYTASVHLRPCIRLCHTPTATTIPYLYFALLPHNETLYLNLITISYTPTPHIFTTPLHITPIPCPHIIPPPNASISPNTATSASNITNDPSIQSIIRAVFEEQLRRWVVIFYNDLFSPQLSTQWNSKLLMVTSLT